jgi:hypothetical protein
MEEWYRHFHRGSHMYNAVAMYRLYVMKRTSGREPRSLLQCPVSKSPAYRCPPVIYMSFNQFLSSIAKSSPSVKCCYLPPFNNLRYSHLNVRQTDVKPTSNRRSVTFIQGVFLSNWFDSHYRLVAHRVSQTRGRCEQRHIHMNVRSLEVKDI